MRLFPRGSALLQALVVTVLGAALGVGLDLFLPRGVLRQAPAVMRDLEFLLPVYLWQPDAAAKALADGRVVLVDGRTREEFEAGHPAGARHIAHDREEDLSEDLVTELSGSHVVVLLGENDFEEARLFARDLAADIGTERVGTLDGGFEAWQRAGLATEALP